MHLLQVSSVVLTQPHAHYGIVCPQEASTNHHPRRCKRTTTVSWPVFLCKSRSKTVYTHLACLVCCSLIRLDSDAVRVTASLQMCGEQRQQPAVDAAAVLLEGFACLSAGTPKSSADVLAARAAALPRFCV